MQIYESAGPEVKEQVSFGLTWPQIMANLQRAAPKKRSYASSYDKFVTEREPKKKKQKIQHAPQPQEPLPTVTPHGNNGAQAKPITEMTCDELKNLLRSRGANVTGKKAELLERLQGLSHS